MMANGPENFEKDFENIAARQLFKARKALAESADFTYEGLKDLHSRTFADTYGHRQEVSDYFAEYDQVRQKSAEWSFWQKGGRPVAGQENSLSIYSNMTDADIKRAEEAITRCRPEHMDGLTFSCKTDRLVEMYREMDYTHTFAEGNSRVNRAFVSEEVAWASGIETDWSQVSQQNMYVARDKALAESACRYRKADMRKYSPPLAQYLQYDREVLEKRFPDVTLKSVFRAVAKPGQKRRLKTHNPAIRHHFLPASAQHQATRF